MLKKTETPRTIEDKNPSAEWVSRRTLGAGIRNETSYPWGRILSVLPGDGRYLRRMSLRAWDEPLRKVHHSAATDVSQDSNKVSCGNPVAWLLGIKPGVAYMKTSALLANGVPSLNCYFWKNHLCTATVVSLSKEQSCVAGNGGDSGGEKTAKEKRWFEKQQARLTKCSFTRPFEYSRVTLYKQTTILCCLMSIQK